MKNFLLCSIVLIAGSTAHSDPLSARCKNAEGTVSIEMVGSTNFSADQNYTDTGATGTLTRAGRPTLPITTGGIMVEVGSNHNEIKVFGFAGRANPGNILVTVENTEFQPDVAVKRSIGFPLVIVIQDLNDEEIPVTCAVEY